MSEMTMEDKIFIKQCLDEYNYHAYNNIIPYSIIRRISSAAMKGDELKELSVIIRSSFMNSSSDLYKLFNAYKNKFKPNASIKEIAEEISKEYLKTMPTPILSTYNKMVAKSIEPLLPTLSDEQREIIENTGYVNLTENSENIINCALLLALEYIHEATNYAESCGGGGSTSSSWGRDKDDDDERWWMRCITQSVTMICNSSRKPKRKR